MIFFWFPDFVMVFWDSHWEICWYKAGDKLMAFDYDSEDDIYVIEGKIYKGACPLPKFLDIHRRPALRVIK